MFKIALVGAGNMASTHARAYHKMSQSELVGVMDINPEAAKRLAGECGGAAFMDFDEMISAVKPDIVDVSVPTPVHMDYVIRAAAYKPKGIVVEKPMARTAEDCRKMIAACKATDVPLFVAHVLRFFPEYVAAREQVNEGAIGNAAVARTRRGGQYPHGTNDWFGHIPSSGGVLLDLVIHDFDWLRWTFGEVERVHSCGIAGKEGAPNQTTRDYALTTLRFKNGVLAHVEGTWCDPAGFSANFEIAGDGGVLDCNFMMKNATPYLAAVEAEDATRQAVPTPDSPMVVNPYQAELEHFLDCLVAGATPRVTPTDGLEAVKISEAALESVRTGQPVQIKAEA